MDISVVGRIQKRRIKMSKNIEYKQYERGIVKNGKVNGIDIKAIFSEVDIKEIEGTKVSAYTSLTIEKEG